MNAIFHLCQFDDYVEYLSIRCTQLKKTGKTHQTHSDCWLKCYNPKLTFSTIICEYEMCNSQTPPRPRWIYYRYLVQVAEDRRHKIFQTYMYVPYNYRSVTNVYIFIFFYIYKKVKCKV